jgi:hypothetical protein
MNSAPPPRTRALVAHRMERFLAGLQRARRQPNRREAYHLQATLEHLKDGQLVEAEAALSSAERAEPLPPHIAGLLSTNAPVALADLIARLARTMEDG